MVDYPHILSRLLDSPLMAHPDVAGVYARYVLERGGIEINVAASAEIAPPHMSPLREQKMLDNAPGQPFLFDPQSGIAVIEVKGALAHKQGFIGSSSGTMGYDGISAQFTAAMMDNAVRGILFDFHTGGGEAAGVFPLADRIAAARGEKPMIGMVDEIAFSAGYLLAAATDEIVLASDIASVGSVGVVMVHISEQEKLANEGIKPTIIQAGDYKADGNPFEDLPDDARARFQASIDQVYDEFTMRVAAWRGLTDPAVRATEAGTFMGQRAIDVGFADEIADPLLTFAAFADELNQSSAPRVALAM